MLKLSVVVRVENEHGANEAAVFSREGQDTETVERELILEFYMDGAQKLCDAIYNIKIPKAPMKAITKRKGAKNVKS